MQLVPLHPGAVAPIVVAVTVRDDEAAAVNQPVAADATEVAEIKDGNVAVSIPPGALTTSKTISVQQLPTTKLQALPPTETFETKTLVVQYGPPGTTFAAPVTITVPLDGGEYCLDATKHCQFLYRPGNDASDGDWAITPGGMFETVPDASAPGGFVTVARLNVTHFSLYTVAAIKPGVRLATSTGETSTTAAFTEGGAPVAVAPSLSGEATIVGAQVVEAKATVDASTYVVGEDAVTLLGATCSRTLTDGDATCTVPANLIPGITFALTADWQVSSGTLTARRAGAGLTMTPEQAGSVLAAIAYTNPSRKPTLAAREVRFTLVEQWSSITTDLGVHTVTISPVNDPPQIGLSSEVLQYTEGQTERMKLAVTLALTDVDSVEVETATVWITPEVALDNLDLESGGLAIPAGNIIYDGDFRLTIKGPASLVDFQEALRRLEYHSANRHPLNLNRTLWIEITDVAAVGTVTAATARVGRNINITTVNDPPEMEEQVLQDGLSVAKISATEDEGPVVNLKMRAKDVEFNPITFAISCQANKGEVRLLNATTGEFTYTPAPDEFGEDVFFALALDGFGAQSKPKEYKIDIENVDDVPVAGDLVGNTKLTVYVGDPARVIFLPISHPDGLDKIKEIHIGPVNGELNLTNATVDGTIQKGKNPIVYQAKKGSDAAKLKKDEFTYTVYDVRNEPAVGTVEIEVLDWDDILNTPPVAYGTTSFAATCVNSSAAANATNATAAQAAPGASPAAANATAFNRSEACVPPKVLSEAGLHKLPIQLTRRV
jgi:hypothetical protein